MPATSINLAIVDDHALFRKTLKNYLSEQTDIQVIAHASSISELLPQLEDMPADVLLMDLFMPGLEGREALKAIQMALPELKVLVLSMNTDMQVASDIMESGAHGYISKADEPEGLLQAIRTVAGGRILRNKWFTGALYWEKQNSADPYGGAADALLNDREKKFLQLLWEEKSNKEIADELFLGVRSIEKMRQDLKEKIGAKSTVGLLKYSINKRIVEV